MNFIQLPKNYLALVQNAFPKLEIREVEINIEGMVNDVLIINHEQVFRFARNVTGQEELKYEAGAIDFISPYLNLNLPKISHSSDDMISYPFIPGLPLTVNLALQFTENQLDDLAQELGRGLNNLHNIKINKAKESGLRNSPTFVQGVDSWKTFFYEAKEFLLPQMGKNQSKEFIELEGFGNDPDFLEFRPSVIHGDICSDYILVDPVTTKITGIIDWGTAGLGDPASDYVGIAFELGEKFLHRMAKSDPKIPTMIEKIRFWVRTMNWQILLKYYRTNDPAWMNCIHSYNRDILPVGSGWIE
jgi:aminoglycoside 2''-phosphotransferase